MKLLQTVIQKFFTVTNRGKTYYIDFINSDDEILLGNRDYWEILDEEWEEVNKKLKIKLINFCIKHFDDYKPDPDDC